MNGLAHTLGVMAAHSSSQPHLGVYPKVLKAADGSTKEVASVADEVAARNAGYGTDQALEKPWQPPTLGPVDDGTIMQGTEATEGEK